MEPTKSLFSEKYSVTTRDLEEFLSAAMDRGGDYADIFFEYKVNHSIVLEEEIVKTATKSVNMGAGVRVISGEKTGYAYSDDLTRDSVLKAARTAAFIAASSSGGGSVAIDTPVMPEHNLYAGPLLPTDLAIVDKIALLQQADRAARDYDQRI